MTVQSPLSSDRIRSARNAIDPVFLDSPLLAYPRLNARLGLSLFLKLETQNPIRSFKGRGTSLFVATELRGGTGVVTASAGNFGQGVAYNATRFGRTVTVFAAETASPLKIAAMRRFGAEVIIHGEDFDAAKAEARVYADRGGGTFLEDGASTAIAEGAGTIAVELTEAVSDLDAIFVPLGNGALATGVGCWVKGASPKTRVVAVAAEGAPSMALSWRNGRPVTTPKAETIADGIAVRIPVPFAVASMQATIDDVVLIPDQAMIEAMAFAYDELGHLIEPAGAAGLAAILRERAALARKRVATVLCGANLTSEQISMWLPQRAHGAETPEKVS
jgi:threonine dehydratase